MVSKFGGRRRELAVASVVLGALFIGLIILLTHASGSSSPPTLSSDYLTASASANTTTEPWALATNKGTIKGFADKVSAGNGETIGLYVTTPASSFDVQVYRLGWYDKGARSAELVDQTRNLRGIVQPAPQVDSTTGLISAANWTSNGSLEVAGWRTGLYLLKLVAADGDQNYIPLVVRDDQGKHDVLFEHSANTDQAYNGWGGKSLYTFNSSSDVTVGGTVAAVKVTFDRPFDGNGAGIAMLSWELDMVRWLEANGFDVAYVSDLDVHRDPQFASRAQAVIQAGHSEYWSKEMRDHLEAVHAQGKGLGFFTGDTGAWAVRFEDTSIGPNRIMDCYRDASLDPLATSDPARATVHWRDAPLNRPTQQFLGVGTNAAVARSADWVAAGVASEPDLFSGTGLKQGDVVPNLVGYEYDGLWSPGAGPSLPSGLQVVGRAIVIPTFALDAERQFSARYDLPDSPGVPVGRLAASIDTLRAGPTWTLMLSLVSSQGTVYLQYETQPVDPVQYKVGQDRYAVIPLAADYSDPGRRPLERDVAADYTAAFGPPPNDLHLSALVTRGTLGLDALSMTLPDGKSWSAPLTVDSPGETFGWRVAGGTGSLDPQPATASIPAELAINATIPADRRPDEADTVAIKGPTGGLVIAVGTIQWSWALDAYGHHVDAKGNETKVDPRIQALTHNMLRQLIASGAGAGS